MNPTTSNKAATETDLVKSTLLQNHDYSLALTRLLNSVRAKSCNPITSSSARPNPHIAPAVPTVRYSYFLNDEDSVHPQIGLIDPWNPPILHIPTNTPPTTWTKQETKTLQSAVLHYYSYHYLIQGLGTLKDLKTHSGPQIIDVTNNHFAATSDETLDIDWNHIVNVYFQNSSKTVLDCKTHWFSTANLIYDRSPLTTQELDLIVSLSQQHSNWFEITDRLPVRRSPSYVFTTYAQHTKSSENLPKIPWTGAQEHMLHQSVSIHGSQNWKAVSSAIGGIKTPKQCYARWKTANRGLHQGPWTDAETCVLRSVVPTANIHWAKVSQSVVGRSEHQCRQHWYTIHRPLTTRIQDRAILGLVCDHGPQWPLIADLLDIHPSSAVLARAVDLIRAIVMGNVPVPHGLHLSSLTSDLRAMDVKFDRALSTIMNHALSAFDVNVPMNPTIASLRTLANAYAAAKTAVPPPITTTSLVPPRVLELLWNTFGLSAMVGSIDPHPVGWQGVDFEIHKRDQILKCRESIELANANVSITE